MKKLVKRTLAMTVAILAMAESAHAQEDFPYFINNAGRKIKVQDLIANEEGDIKVALDGGGTQTIKRADYRSAYVPKPQQVALLQQMYEQKAFDRLLQNVDGVFDRVKYLGWGGFLSYMKAEAQLAAGQADAAQRTADLGMRFAREEDLELLNMSKAKALLAMNRKDELGPILEKLKNAESPQAAAFSFMTQGILLADQGREDEAILELMKTVLLFEPRGEIAPIHEQARQKLVELLKAKNDPSFKKFEK